MFELLHQNFSFSTKWIFQFEIFIKFQKAIVLINFMGIFRIAISNHLVLRQTQNGRTEAFTRTAVQEE